MTISILLLALQLSKPLAPSDTLLRVTAPNTSPSVTVKANGEVSISGNEATAIRMFWPQILGADYCQHLRRVELTPRWPSGKFIVLRIIVSPYVSDENHRISFGSRGELEIVGVTVSDESLGIYQALGHELSQACWVRPFVSNDRRPIGRASVVAAIAGHVADTATTLIGVTHGSVETNPTIKGLANRPAALGAVKFGVGLGTVWLTSKLPPTWARVINWSAAGLLGSMAVHNLQVLR